jgi:LPXTG-motif cell wall-anchored protein
MLEDSGSVNAHAPLTVVNTRGFDLPSTGDRGIWMYGLLGILLMTGSAVTIIVTSRKKAVQK